MTTKLDALMKQRGEELLFSTWLSIRGDKKVGLRYIVMATWSLVVISENGRIDQDVHLLEITAISSHDPKQLNITTKGTLIEATCDTEGPIDELITTIRTAYERSFPAVPEAYRLRVDIEPRTRVKDISQAIGVCGGYKPTYMTLRNYYGLPTSNSPICDAVLWDIDNIFAFDRILDLRKFNLFEFDAPCDEMKALVAPLQFNRYFRGFVLKNFKLEKDLVLILTQLLRYSAYLEEITLSYVTYTKDSLIHLLEAMAHNHNLGLTQLDLSNTLLDEKGFAALSTYLGKEQAGRLHTLNLSGCGIGKSAMKQVREMLDANTQMLDSLTKLDVSHNRLDSQASQHLAHWLERPNALQHLNLSSTSLDCDVVFQALPGCMQLTKLDVSYNKMTVTAWQDMALYIKACLFLEHLDVSGCQVPIEVFPDIVTGPNQRGCHVYLRDNNLGIMGGKALGFAIKSATHIVSLDLSDNDLREEGLVAVIEGLMSSTSLKTLILNGNFGRAKKSPGDSIQGLLKLMTQVTCPISTLGVAGSPKADLRSEICPLLTGLVTNTSLTSLDISGNDMGNQGAAALSRLLHRHTALSTLHMDNNSVGYVGYQSVLLALDNNTSLRYLPAPYSDVNMAAKSDPRVLPIMAEISAKIHSNCQLGESRKKEKETDEEESMVDLKIRTPDQEDLTSRPWPLLRSQSASMWNPSIPSGARPRETSTLSLSSRRKGKEEMRHPHTVGPMNKMRSAPLRRPALEGVSGSVKDYHAELKRIVSTKKLAVLFREYLHQCFNSENFSFWLEAEEYRNIDENDPSLPKRAQQMYDKYLSDGTLFEVNLSAKIKKHVSDNIATPTSKLYQEAQNAIWSLMVSDCVPNFLKSELYKAGAPPRRIRSTKALNPNFCTMRMLEDFLVSGEVDQRDSGKSEISIHTALSTEPTRRELSSLALGPPPTRQPPPPPE